MLIFFDCIVFFTAGYFFVRVVYDYTTLTILLGQRQKLLEQVLTKGDRRADICEKGDDRGDSSKGCDNERARAIRVYEEWVRFKLHLIAGSFFWVSAGIAAAALVGSLGK